jgi:cytochrome c oxidase subunit I
VSFRQPVAAADNPWDAGSLEWWTTSPPPHHNFLNIPPIRSERPVWDFHHPDAKAVPSHGSRAGQLSKA